MDEPETTNSNEKQSEDTKQGTGTDGGTDEKESDIGQNKKDFVINIKLSKTNKKNEPVQIVTKKSSSFVPISELEIATTTMHSVSEETEDDLLSSDSGSSILMEKGYVNQEPLEMSEDFFEKLGSVPSLSLFEDRTFSKYSEKSEVSERPTKYSEYGDVGSFTNPLTGSILLDEEEEEGAVEEEAEEEHLESSTDSMMEITEDDELLELIKPEQEKIEQPTELDEEQAFETFMEMEKEHIIEEEVEFDWVTYERECELQRVTTITHEFLKDLIKRVVYQAEYVDPKVLLREKLDKAYLMEDIINKLQELESEQRAHTFLNRRVCEFFHRKGQHRVFADDASGILQNEEERFKEVRTRLDQMLGREQELKLNSRELIVQLRHQKSVLELRNNEKLSEFEQLVRKTASSRGERVRLLVDSLLRNMAKLRDEISAVRYVLIQAQHNNAVLNEQLITLEDIGNNLRLRDYECLQTEVQALDKKIEERNADLNKSRLRCNSNLHVMGHLKEKQAMLRNKVHIQKRVLVDIYQQKHVARESVFAAKIQRQQIRDVITELSFQCGLLDKPALMLDYDATVKQVKETTIRIQTLRHKHDDIIRKIAKFEGKCL